jgi:enterochelin esterase-like enzyme
MFEAGDESLVVDMEKVEGTDYWTTSMPLPGGHYQYVFLVDGDTENKLEDPTNPREASGVENGNCYDRSTFYVPRDEEKQSDSVDFTFMAPREDGQSGTVEYVNYTDVNGDEAPLGIYLPYGYDADSETPYKVVYLSHGGGGYECDWFAGGSVDYIFDNMIAEGTTEPVVLVTMNNTAYQWDFEVIVNNLIDNIIPYVEENYNVSSDPSDRAFTGLSMGGMTTTNVLFRVPEYFGYIGIQSGADVSFDTTDVDFDAVKDTTIMLGAGIYDFGLVREVEEGQEDTFSITALSAVLDENGVEYGWEEAYGSHDWNTWPQLIKVFAENYLWK